MQLLRTAACALALLASAAHGGRVKNRDSPHRAARRDLHDLASGRGAGKWRDCYCRPGVCDPKDQGPLGTEGLARTVSGHGREKRHKIFLCCADARKGPNWFKAWSDTECPLAEGLDTISAVMNMESQWETRMVWEFVREDVRNCEALEDESQEECQTALKAILGRAQDSDLFKFIMGTVNPMLAEWNAKAKQAKAKPSPEEAEESKAALRQRVQKLMVNWLAGRDPFAALREAARALPRPSPGGSCFCQVGVCDPVHQDLFLEGPSLAYTVWPRGQGSFRCCSQTPLADDWLPTTGEACQHGSPNPEMNPEMKLPRTWRPVRANLYQAFEQWVSQGMFAFLRDPENCQTLLQDAARREGQEFNGVFRSNAFWLDCQSRLGTRAADLLNPLWAKVDPWRPALDEATMREHLIEGLARKFVPWPTGLFDAFQGRVAV